MLRRRHFLCGAAAGPPRLGRHAAATLPAAETAKRVTPKNTLGNFCRVPLFVEMWLSHAPNCPPEAKLPFSL